MGKGRVHSEEQARWRPVVREVYKGEMTPYQKQQEEPWDGSDLTIVFQEANSFL